MGNLLKTAVTLLAAFCIATLVAQSIGLAMLWSQGALQSDRLQQAMSALYGVDLAAIAAEQQAAKITREEQDIAFQQVVMARAEKNLDLDMREQSLRNGLADLRNLQSQLIEERKRYALLKTSFEEHLQTLQNIAKDNAILEVQRTLEAVKPKQAKEHILRMLPERFAAGELAAAEFTEAERKAVIAVVTMIKAMPIDKRKKILAEFRTEEEAATLAEILRLIRIGVPDVSLIEDVRDRLREFNPRPT